VIFATPPLNFSREEALAYTGWAPKFFDMLERGNRIEGRPWGRNGAKLYSRAQLEAVMAEEDAAAATAGAPFRVLCWEEDDNGITAYTGCGTGTPVATGKISEALLTEMLHREADGAETGSICYFIGSEAGPVKIGYSGDVRERLRRLQHGSPYRLRVLATADGGAARERAYHWQFRSAWSHGEWFERTPKLLAEIAWLNAGGGMEGEDG
jgi:hypothetical protein